MRKLLLAAAALALSGGAAQAGTIWATEVTTAGPGGFFNVACNTPDRDDACNALGSPDGVGGSSASGFVSTANFDTLTFSFGQDFLLPVHVFEITTGTPSTYEEILALSFSVVGGGFTTELDILNVDGVAVTNDRWQYTISFGDVDLAGPYNAIVVNDNSDLMNGTRDGFDIDAIGVTPVPLPAAGWMLLAGLGGMAALRRRQKS